MTKPTKWPVCPAKTQINLGIRPVWWESLLSAWRNIWPLTTYWAHSEDSNQMPRLIWVFAGRTCHFVGFVMRLLIFWQVSKLTNQDSLILWRCLSCKSQKETHACWKICKWSSVPWRWSQYCLWGVRSQCTAAVSTDQRSPHRKQCEHFLGTGTTYLSSCIRCREWLVQTGWWSG